MLGKGELEAINYGRSSARNLRGAQLPIRALLAVLMDRAVRTADSAVYFSTGDTTVRLLRLVVV